MLCEVVDVDCYVGVGYGFVGSGISGTKSGFFGFSGECRKTKTIEVNGFYIGDMQALVVGVGVVCGDVVVGKAIDGELFVVYDVLHGGYVGFFGAGYGCGFIGCDRDAFDEVEVSGFLDCRGYAIVVYVLRV